MMDPNQTADRPTVCPECGVAFQPEKSSCWLCGWKMGDPIRVRPPQQMDTRLTTFSLSTMFLWTVLVGMVMSIVRIAPATGIALGIFSLCIAAYTFAIAAKRKRSTGRALPVYEKVFCFVETFALFPLYAIGILIAISLVIGVFCLIWGAFVQAGGENPTALISGSVARLLVVGLIVLALIRSLRR